MVRITQQNGGGSNGINKCLLLLLVAMGAAIVVLSLQLQGLDAQLFDSFVKHMNGGVDCPDPTQQQQQAQAQQAQAQSQQQQQLRTEPPAIPAAVVPVAVTASTSIVSRSMAEEHKDFLALGRIYGTDKVQGQGNWDVQKFQFEGSVNRRCKVWGHFYHTMYQKWLGPYSTQGTEKFQFLEIGYSNGGGFATFVDFLPTAEHHSVEYNCDLLQNRQAGKPWHAPYTQAGRFHCGDSSNVDFLMETYAKMQQSSEGGLAPAPPLKVVVEDASHISAHQAAAVFFWFPRLEPGGLMVIEDVQPNGLSNQFRQEFLPQIMMDLHYCGGYPREPADALCFPTLQPLLKSIHCEMHICILERNEMPAVKNLSREDSIAPPNALNMDMCRQKKKRALGQ